VKLKRSIAIILFCFFLLPHTAAISAEGVSVPLAKPPSVSITKQPIGVMQGGAAEQSAVTEQPTIPAPPKKIPELTEADKQLEGIDESQVQQQISKQNIVSQILKVLPIFFLILLVLIILILLLNKLRTKAKAAKPVEQVRPSQPIQEKEEEGPQTVTDAVVSFVKHRLKK